MLYLHELYNKTQGEMDRLNLGGGARILKGGGGLRFHTDARCMYIAPYVTEFIVA